jgi:hypothetical protein
VLRAPAAQAEAAVVTRRGRPRYWTPARIARLWSRAQTVAEELEQWHVVNLDVRRKREADKTAVARRLKEKYRYPQTERQLQEMLSKQYEKKKSIAERDKINTRMVAHLLRDKKN